MQWYEEEIRRLEQQPVAPAGRPRVVFYGSSTFTGWLDLAHAFPQIQAVNLGFGGSTLAACAWFFRRVVPRQQPAALVLYAGDNDLGDGRTPEEVVLFFEQLLASIRAALGAIPVCFIAIKPSLARQHLRGSIDYANHCIQQHTQQDAALSYLDLTPLMVDARHQPQPTLFEPDGLHLSAAGYMLWQREISAQLVRMLPALAAAHPQ